MVGDIAKLLGASENTVRRMEAEGVIPKARRTELARRQERAGVHREGGRAYREVEGARAVAGARHRDDGPVVADRSVRY